MAATVSCILLKSALINNYVMRHTPDLISLMTVDMFGKTLRLKWFLNGYLPRWCVEVPISQSVAVNMSYAKFEMLNHEVAKLKPFVLPRNGNVFCIYRRINILATRPCYLSKQPVNPFGWGIVSVHPSPARWLYIMSLETRSEYCHRSAGLYHTSEIELPSWLWRTHLVPCSQLPLTQFQNNGLALRNCPSFN